MSRIVFAQPDGDNSCSLSAIHMTYMTYMTWAATKKAMTHHTTAREAGELEAQGRELEGP